MIGKETSDGLETSASEGGEKDMNFVVFITFRERFLWKMPKKLLLVQKLHTSNG